MIDELYKAIAAKLPPKIPFYLGAEHVAAEGAFPKIVMFPDYEELGAGASVLNDGKPEKATARRVVYVVFYVFARGETIRTGSGTQINEYAQLEALVGTLLDVIKKEGITKTNYQGARVDYLTADEKVKARAARLTLPLESAYVAASTWAIIQAIEQTC